MSIFSKRVYSFLLSFEVRHILNYTDYKKVNLIHH